MKNSLNDGDFTPKTSPLTTTSLVKSTNLRIECLLQMWIQKKSEEWYKQKNQCLQGFSIPIKANLPLNFFAIGS
jgi:hypothetical protein